MTFLALRAVLGRIPRSVWIALAAVALIGIGALWHGHRVKAFGNEHYAAGRADRDKEIRDLQAKLNAATARVSAEIRKRSDEENRRIAGTADALRVSGPGRARASCPPAAASGYLAPGGNADAAGPQVPASDLAAVPWPWLVERAEQADLNRGEVIAWREFYRRLVEEWGKR